MYTYKLLEKKKKKKRRSVQKRYPVHYVGMIGYGPLYHNGMCPDYEKKLKDDTSVENPLPHDVEPAAAEAAPAAETTVAVAEEFTTDDTKKILMRCIEKWFKPNGDYLPLRCFILPDGRIIDVGKGAHYVIEDKIDEHFNDYVYYGDRTKFDDDITDEQIKIIWNNIRLLENKYGWDGGSVILEIWFNAIRCNGYKERYVVIDDNTPLTSQQYNALEEWLTQYYDNGHLPIQITTRGSDGGFGENGSYVVYYPNETTSEQIIKKIKRYYTSGVLLEKQGEEE